MFYRKIYTPVIERERKMSKQKQTTLFQTWGYEGNLPPSQQGRNFVLYNSFLIN